MTTKIYRRSDTESKLSQLKAQEQQLLELLARESELSASQRVQLLEQLELWEKKRMELEQEEANSNKMILPQVHLHLVLHSSVFGK
jgi:hypothetical protein